MTGGQLTAVPGLAAFNHRNMGDAKGSILPCGKPSLTASSTKGVSGEPSAASVAGLLGSGASALPSKGGTHRRAAAKFCARGLGYSAVVA